MKHLVGILSLSSLIQLSLVSTLDAAVKKSIRSANPAPSTEVLSGTQPDTDESAILNFESATQRGISASKLSGISRTISPDYYHTGGSESDTDRAIYNSYNSKWAIPDSLKGFVKCDNKLTQMQRSYQPPQGSDGFANNTDARTELITVYAIENKIDHLCPELPVYQTAIDSSADESGKGEAAGK